MRYALLLVAMFLCSCTQSNFDVRRVEERQEELVAPEVPAIEDDIQFALEDAVRTLEGGASGSLVDTVQEAKEEEEHIRSIMIFLEKDHFSPPLITLTQDEKVEFTIIGRYPQRSFAIDELGINMAASSGYTMVTSVPTHTPGNYPIYCSVCTGSAALLRGKLVIEEK